MIRSFVKLLVLVKAVTKVGTGCLSMTKVAIFVIGDYIDFMCHCEIMGLLLVNYYGKYGALNHIFLSAKPKLKNNMRYPNAGRDTVFNNFLFVW